MKYTMGLGLMAFAMGLGGACSVEGPDEDSRTLADDDANTATASFALTGQCGQCAATAVQNVCLQKAQQCLQDPNCANASACVQACPQGDALCIAQCHANAGQALDVLAECVVCQECPMECAGAWQCGGGAGGGGGHAGGSSMGGGNAGGSSSMGGSAPVGVCDNQGVCAACLSCAAQGPCQAKVDACLQDPLCITDPVKSKAAFSCTFCDECKNDCAGQAPPVPGLCGP